MEGKTKAVANAKKMMKVHGITIEQYEELSAIQHGCCLECKKPQTRKGYRLCVHYVPGSKTIHGLFCFSCEMKSRPVSEEVKEKMSIALKRHFDTESVDGGRRCIKCNDFKLFINFPAGRTRRDGSPRYAWCKVCHGNYQRASRLRNFFLITVEDADKIFSYQGNLCAICKRPPLGGKRHALDHRHSDGLIRGGLCSWCNRAIARFNDDVVKLRSALEYLEHPPAVRALGREHFARPGRVGTKKQRAIIRKEKEAREKNDSSNRD